MKNFLENNHSLLKAVYYDLSVKEYVAGCKALELVSRLITGPLCSLLGDKTIHILDMNQHYLDLTTPLNDLDIEQVIMNGNLEIFGRFTVINKDPVSRSLIQPWEHDHLVKVLLSVILPALGDLCKKKTFSF